jgi:hypothetical protein
MLRVIFNQSAKIQRWVQDARVNCWGAFVKLSVAVTAFAHAPAHLRFIIQKHTR